MFTFLYGLSLYGWIGQAALFLSYPFAYILGAGALVYAACARRSHPRGIILVALSLGVATIAASALKYIFHVARPFIELGFVPLHMETGYSFPSGHSAVFASLAVVMLSLNKRIGIFFAIAAFLIGVSRVVIGVHYPTDVIAGWATGIIVGALLVRIFRAKK